jgi:hypothetical protein
MDEYRALVASRKACRICIERSPGRIRSCAEFAFDPDVVSHWEQWLGHRNPKLLVVGQDFGNVAYFVRHRGRDEPHNKTNDNLRKLLAEAGIHVQTSPPDRDIEAPVFMTNSILCVKEGRMTQPIRASWISACTETTCCRCCAFSSLRSLSAWGMRAGAQCGRPSGCGMRRA